MEKSTIALLAGVWAIENNKRLCDATYVYDIFGSAEKISFAEAAELLREEAEQRLDLKNEKGEVILCP